MYRGANEALTVRFYCISKFWKVKSTRSTSGVGGSCSAAWWLVRHGQRWFDLAGLTVDTGAPKNVLRLIFVLLNINIFFGENRTAVSHH